MWRLLRRPVAILRMVKALVVGAGPQFGRQVRRLTDEDFTRDLVSSLLVAEEVVEVAFARDGMVWRSDLGDEIGRQLFRCGSYEGEEIDAVLRWLAEQGRTGTVLDVGANIGTTTVPFARAGFPVIAVEPVPRTFALLTANAAASGLAEAITPVQVAVAAEPGHVDMWVGYGSGRSEVVVEGTSPDMEARGTPTTVSVPAAPLHQVLADQGVAATDVALVWADVQGCETDVVTTATHLWAAGVPLWLEVDPVRLERQAGLAAFLATVAEHFSAFVSRDDMLAGEVEPQPVAAFAPWVDRIPAGRYEDALLLP
ncbi:MAG TPA: FkbM family methyltransferase [Iamia sp.]